MKKSTLRSRLLLYIRKRYPRRIAKGDIERMASLHSRYTPDNIGRTLRLLEEKGLIIVTYNQQGHAEYQASAPKSYLIVGREEDKLTIPTWE